MGSFISKSPLKVCLQKPGRELNLIPKTPSLNLQSSYLLSVKHVFYIFAAETSVSHPPKKANLFLTPSYLCILLSNCADTVSNGLENLELKLFFWWGGGERGEIWWHFILCKFICIIFFLQEHRSLNCVDMPNISACEAAVSSMEQNTEEVFICRLSVSNLNLCAFLISSTESKNTLNLIL